MPIFKVIILSLLCHCLLSANEPVIDLPSNGKIDRFVDGDVIAFAGDSITCGGSYHKYIYHYWITRYPSVKIDIQNKGIFSDFVHGGINRLDHDILKESPNRLYVNFGMNDSGASWQPDLYHSGNISDEVKAKREELYKKFGDNMQKLRILVESKGIKMGLIGPSIYDENLQLKGANHIGANDGIRKLVTILKTISNENDLEFVDFNQAMLMVNHELQKDNPSYTIVGRDRVHPSSQGHYLMAYMFLKAQGNSELVSKIVVDAKRAKLIESQNCAVESLVANDEGVEFIYKPKSLPLAVDREYKLASKVLAITDALNQETIKVSGLLPGNYKISFGEVKVGEWSANELSQGVNIACIPYSPQQKHSQQVYALLQSRNAIEMKIRMLRQRDARFLNKTQMGNREQLLGLLKQEFERCKASGNKQKIEVFSGYFEDFDKEPIYEKKVVELTEKIYQTNKPKTYKVRISSLDAPSAF